MDKLVKRLFYSEETKNILNLATLSIKDADVKRKYDEERVKNFNLMWLPFTVVQVLWLLNYLIEYAAGMSPNLNAIWVRCVYVLHCAIWGILKWKFPNKLRTEILFLRTIFTMWDIISDLYIAESLPSPFRKGIVVHHFYFIMQIIYTSLLNNNTY